MNDWTDRQLLREYAEHKREDAFALLVSRHLGMVYHAALRQTRQAELAEEVVQTVFTLLARKAARLSVNATLSGWLFNTARFVSTRAVRNEMRRQRRQAEAARMNSDSHSTEPLEAEEETLPALDEMLARLPRHDREILLAHYFEGKTFVQIAAVAGASDEAVKKRAQRALEKLRGMIGARGAVLGVAAVAAALEAVRAQTVPVGLSAAAVSSVAVKGAAGVVPLSALTGNVLQIIRWSKIKLLGATAAGVACATFTANYYLGHYDTALAKAPAAGSRTAQAGEITALQATADRLQNENAQLAVALAAATARKAQLEVAKQNAERTAGQFKEMTARNLATNGSPTTMREGWACAGRMIRLRLASEKENLAPEQRKASLDALAQEMRRAAQAAAQFNFDDYAPSSPEDAADLEACLLQGLLDLNAQQFASVSEVLAKLELQAVQQSPSHKPTLTQEESITSGQMADQIQNLLTQDQIDTLRQLSQRNKKGAHPRPNGNKYGL